MSTKKKKGGSTNTGTLIFHFYICIFKLFKNYSHFAAFRWEKCQDSNLTGIFHSPPLQVWLWILNDYFHGQQPHFCFFTWVAWICVDSSVETSRCSEWKKKSHHPPVQIWVFFFFFFKKYNKTLIFSLQSILHLAQAQNVQFPMSKHHGALIWEINAEQNKQKLGTAAGTHRVEIRLKFEQRTIIHSILSTHQPSGTHVLSIPISFY